jgi:outer membrane murein-binding lipoprotein Lpp
MIDWQHVKDSAPFIGMMARSGDAPFTTRIIESLIIAAVPLIFTLLISFPRMEDKIASVSSQVEKVDAKVDKLNDKVDGRIDKLNDKVDGKMDKYQRGS